MRVNGFCPHTIIKKGLQGRHIQNLAVTIEPSDAHGPTQVDKITLTGHAGEWFTRQLAGAAAKKSFPRAEIIDQITVKD